MLLAGFFSIILYFISLSFTLHDPKHMQRYFIFFLYIISIAPIVFVYLKSKFTKETLHKTLQAKEIFPFALILIAVEFVSYFMLLSYPFVNVGDGVRDAGLDALRITTGNLTNFFTYANYNGYGRIIPVFASFFYQLFGSSVLTYRLPGAIIATLDVCLLYLLLRLITNKPIAVLGSLVLAFFPLHMYYARVELVVLFDSFWTTLLLLLFYVWTKRKSAIDYAMLGTAIGIAANFHTAVRIVALLLAIVVIVTTIRKHFSAILLFLVFCFVGFGPLLIASNSSNFLQQKRYVAAPVTTVEQKYVQSLLVWVHEGTTSRYPPHTPLLPIPLFILFLIGAGYALYLKSTFFTTLVLFVFILPFTNSAMTDWVNADHRLLPLLPVAAVLIALSLHFFTIKTKNVVINNLFYAIFLCFLVFLPYQFFTHLLANDDKTLKDYLSMHIINQIQAENKTNPHTANLCLFVSPMNYKNLDLLHYKEQYRYFLPQTAVELQKNEKIPDNEAYVFRSACPLDYKEAMKRHTILCTEKKVNYCPANFIGEITIFTNE